MKKSWILACVLLFATVAAFAQTPSRPPLSREALAAILGQPVAGSCATQPADIRQVAKRPGALPEKSTLCTATATCQFGNSVSCSSSVNAANCTAVNANCNTEPGHVTCDGQTTSCPACCSGTPRQVSCCKCEQTGDCFACCFCGGGGPVACSRECSS